MYIEKSVVYSDAGKYLVANGRIGIQFKDSDLEFTEEEITYDLTRSGNRIYYNNGLFYITIVPKWTYGDYKKSIIKNRYSNDDQIAIILNKDDSSEDLLRYKRMMEWRDYAAKLSRMIIDYLAE